jgi:hypothetical protein
MSPFNKRRNSSDTGSVAEPGLDKYDHLSPEESVVAAWTASYANPELNETAKDQVRDAMPLLARALDRMANDASDNDDDSEIEIPDQYVRNLVERGGCF